MKRTYSPIEMEFDRQVITFDDNQLTIAYYLGDKFVFQVGQTLPQMTTGDEFKLTNHMISGLIKITPLLTE